MKASLLFEQLICKRHLSDAQMEEVIQSCMSGELNDTQIAVFLALMRSKGESVAELTTAANVMRSFAHPLDLGGQLIDIVGTGGDQKNTFNVSTACSFVVAACGIKVAKHGNHSVSSQSGSADLLEAAGFKLSLSDKAIQQCVEQCNVAFLYAPHYHPAMQNVRAARRQLGIRTLFNLLGPLLNPASVKRQVLGVYAKEWMQPLADVLVNLGSERILVIHSQDGMDEISISAKTHILEQSKGQVRQWLLNPADYGIKHRSLQDVVVNSSTESLIMIQSVLNGEKNAARDMVLLNSAAAIYCAHEQLNFSEALEQATFAIDKGKAAECFKQLQQLTVTLANE